MEIYPGKIFRRQAGMPGQSIYGLKFPNTAPENMMMFDKARQIADDATGIPSYSHGQTGVQGTGRTAAGISMLMGAAQLSIKSVVKNINEDFDFLIDMESFDIFKVCSKLVPIHRIVFLKVVSDYVNENFQKLNATLISELISSNLIKFKIYFNSLIQFSKLRSNILNNDDATWVREISKVLSLTESQKTIIFNKVKEFRLRKKDEKLPFLAIKPPNSKSNQKKTLKEINDQLSI